VIGQEIKKDLTKYFSTVKWLKIGLIAIILGATAVIGAMAFLSEESNHLELKYESVKQESESEKSVIVKPVLYGKDSKDRAFMITASVGRQIKKNIIELEQVEFKFTFKEEESEGGSNPEQWLMLTSTAGVVFLDYATIDLRGGVNIINYLGDTMTTEGVQILYKDRTATSKDGLHIKSSMGTMDAKEMQVLDHDNRVLFKSVRMRVKS
jgi:hypothetical protein